MVFNVPNYPSAKDVSYEARTHFTSSEEQLLKSEAENLNFFEYVELFKNLMLAQPCIQMFDAKRFQMFCDEYISLKTLYPQQQFVLDKDISCLQINYKDENLFKHSIRIKANFYSKHNKLYEVDSHSFPEVNSDGLFSAENSLKYLHKKFMHFAHSLSCFYERCSKIDDICWVIDPPHPTSKQNWRRIAVGKCIKT